MSEDNLKIYLNDHLAGSVSALELLEELIKSTGDASTSFLSQLKSDIEADQQELKALIQRLDMAESGPRKAAAWLAGKLVDLKSMVQVSRCAAVNPPDLRFYPTAIVVR